METLLTREVGGFGNQKTRILAKGFKFTLGGVSVRAKTTESICRPLTGKGFNKKEMGRFTHSKGLNLADNFESNEKPIDILIGGDYFYTFVGDRVIRGSYGPVAVETSFGYTLSGGIPPKNTLTRSCKSVIYLPESSHFF